MRKHHPITEHNASLTMPTDEEVLAAVREVCAEKKRKHEEARARGFHYAMRYVATSNDVAYRLGMVGADRHGRGAVAGSWSGRMSPALRIAPRLRSMHKRGMLANGWDEYSRHVYWIEGDDD